MNLVILGRPEDEQWGFLKDDELVQHLCSSVARAQSRQVQELDLSGHQMQVVQGLHPQYGVQREPTWEDLLMDLFVRVFRPFGVWESRRAAIQQELCDAGHVLLGMVGLLKMQMELYKRLCKRAASAVEGPVPIQHVGKLERKLIKWEENGNMMRRRQS
ncbi:hypothetical protein BDV33DRAFT_209244 [Aspergillus novoparasiticus]|uniref:Uncharacterized protein n=1 Tax=Aspergillus novoparasiticus TaxID=986946 RepID=A0A5N6EDS4_9EURO|nr:hypothetical protein BDV33DRAFT_209244 [Aspergillus novoparasiticus]